MELHAMASTMDVETGGRHHAGLEGHHFDCTNSMQIVYHNLKYTVKLKDKKEGFVLKDIVKEVSGVIHPGRLTACMGASGAGKTTLLNVLAGNLKGEDKVERSISVNGEPMVGNRMRQILGFVHQEDIILDTMTVREALTFSAVLKLPSSMSRKEKEQRALEAADMLNLTESLDSLVGSSLIKGISGGEKRRLSLGMELITNPPTLFLDEPTSGLDTYTAFKVTKILQHIPQSQGRTVLCTIHQPSSEIFQMSEDLIVLSDGHMLYQGAASHLVTYFGSLGYRCPTYTNPADFLFMEVLNAGQQVEKDVATFAKGAKDRHVKSTARLQEEERRVVGLLESWSTSSQQDQIMAMISKRNPQGLSSQGVSQQAVIQSAPFTVQLPLLARRAMYNAWRNTLILKGKVGQTLGTALIVGLIYLDIGGGMAGVQDRQGSLFFLCFKSVFGSLMGVITVFGTEKAVFLREYHSRMYGLPSYFISRWLTQLPTLIILPVVASCVSYFMIGYQREVDKFLWFALTLVLLDSCGASLGMFVGSLFNNIAVALNSVPLMVMPLMVSSGFFVNSKNIPPYFIWISYISPVRYGFIALAKNEFEGLKIDCPPTDKVPCPTDFMGEAVIRQMGFINAGSVQRNLAILFAYMWAFLLLAHVALWFSVRRRNK